MRLHLLVVPFLTVLASRASAQPVPAPGPGVAEAPGALPPALAEPEGRRATACDACLETPLLLQTDCGSHLRAKAGQRAVVRFRAEPVCPPGCGPRLEFEVQGLPRSAGFQPRALDGTADLEWTPAGPEGRTEVTVRATRGAASATRRVTLEAVEEWETYFLPGLQYTLLLPADDATFGLFQGLSIQYVLAAWIHRNDNRGPSHGRAWLDVDLLFSNRRGVSEAVLYEVGVDLSFERNPSRRWLVPYFGLGMGGFYQKSVGNTFELTPFAGVHVWASRNVFVHLSAGYLVPAKRLEQLRGLRAQAGFNVTFW